MSMLRVNGIAIGVVVFGLLDMGARVHFVKS